MVPSSDASIVVRDPFERLLRVRVALDEITDSEESIAVGVEGEGAECVIERAEESVDVTDHDGPPSVVASECCCDRFPLRSRLRQSMVQPPRASRGRRGSPIPAVRAC